MKRKATLSAVIATLLVTVMLLSSCGGAVKSITSYFDIFDKEMPYESSVSYDTKNVAIPELNNYAVASYTEEGKTVDLVNEEFAVFVKLTETGILSHKVLSLRSGKVVATLAEKDATHEIRFVEDAPAFFVKKTVIDPNIDILLGLDNVVSVSYSLYDAEGNCVVTSDNKELPYALADLVIYDYAAYTYDNSGVFSKKSDVPEYLLLDKCFYWNDKYLYVEDSQNGYTVYDRDFNSVSYWCTPGYDMDGCDMYVLNNNDVLVQYKIILDNDATDFDYVINNDDYLNLKIDLKTFIVDVESGEAKELKKFSYIVGGAITKESMLRENDDEKAADYFKFENLVTLIPIVDQHLDDSHASVDLVKFGNDGKIEASVKFVEYQSADIPARIDEDLFTVGLLTGQTAIIKENGEIVHKLDKSYRIVDKYIVGTQAIYDFDLEKVYDIRKNKGTVMGIIDNTVYVQEKTDGGFNIVAFNKGETKKIYSFNIDNPSGNVFELMTDAHCYMIYNAASGEFSYYNSEDEGIINTTDKLSLRYASESHSTYLMWTATTLEPSYCLFVGAAE